MTGGMWRGPGGGACANLGELTVPGLARNQASRTGPAHVRVLVGSPWPEEAAADELGLVPWAALGSVCRPRAQGWLPPLALWVALRVSSLAGLSSGGPQ